MYFVCGNGIQAVSREIGDSDPIRSAVNGVLNGPSAQETTDGFEPAATDGLTARVDVANGLVTVDLAPEALPVQRFLASSFFLTTLLEATVEQFDDVKAVVLTLDGKDACALSDEC